MKSVLNKMTKLGEKRSLKLVEMALFVDHTSSCFLLTSSIFSHARFSFSQWWFPGSQGQGVRLLLAKLHQGATYNL